MQDHWLSIPHCPKGLDIDTEEPSPCVLPLCPVAWFKESGYTIVEDKREPSIYDSMAYKEMTELARDRGFNGIGLKKEDLVKALILWDKEHNTKTETEE